MLGIASDGPLITVIMNCRNGRLYLHHAIKSVVSQTYKNWEIIFWDNASKDQSAELAEQFHDSRIKIYSSDLEVSLGEARNLALSQAKGEFITFLDVDDFWYPRKLEIQIEQMISYPGVAVIYSNYHWFRSIDNLAPHLTNTAFYFEQPSGFIFAKLLKRASIHLPTVMLRRSILISEKIEFDPNLHLVEEFDVFMRILYRHEAIYLRNVLVGYRLHDNQNSVKKLYLYPIEAGYLLNKLKNLYPESVAAFKGGYEYYSAKIAYYEARVKIRNNQIDEALILIRPHIFQGWNFFFVYFSIHISPAFYRYIHKISGRYL
jgi:glycosyltransferase involved in cell wall biosynthesis